MRAMSARSPQSATVEVFKVSSVRSGDPLDPAELHYMSAQSLKASDPVLAKRHVLQCLEIAPRYLQAYELLEHLSSETTETRVSE